MGERDPRVGVIRARAAWSVILEPYRKFHKTTRVRFYCADCWASIEAARDKPIPGIDRPPHASDFWKPSLMEMIRLADIQIKQQERTAEPPGYFVYRQQDESVRRIREMPPAQYAQLLHLRRMTDELRTRARSGSAT